MRFAEGFFCLIFGLMSFMEGASVSAMCRWARVSDKDRAQVLKSKVMQVKALQKPQGGMKTWNGEEIDLSGSRNVLCLLNGISLISGISPFGTNNEFFRNRVFTFFDMFEGISVKEELDASLQECDKYLRNAIGVILNIDKRSSKKLLALLSVFSPEVHYIYLSNSEKSGLPLHLLNRVVAKVI